MFQSWRASRPGSPWAPWTLSSAGGRRLTRGSHLVIAARQHRHRAQAVGHERRSLAVRLGQVVVQVQDLLLGGRHLHVCVHMCMDAR